MPNLANFEKLKSRTHTYLKCLLESRFWVEKSKRAKRYAHGSSFAQKVPNRATLSLTKVAKWFFGRLLLVQKVCQASSCWLNEGKNGKGGVLHLVAPLVELFIQGMVHKEWPKTSWKAAIPYKAMPWDY